MTKDFSKNIGDLNKTDDREQVGIAGFVLDVRINESIQFTSDVPDNYVEDGSFVNDHIINNPIIITLDGEVSDIIQKDIFEPEVTTKNPDKAEDIPTVLYPSNKTASMKQKTDGYAKPLTKAYDNLDNDISKGKQLYPFFKGPEGKSIQSKFFAFLNNIYASKQLIDIETPFQTYKNMRITSFTIIRDNVTQQAVKYKLSAKEVRFAETIYVDKNKYFKAPTPSVAGKTSDKKNQGVKEGQPQQKSFLGTLLS